MEPIILRLSLLSMLFYGLTVQAAVIQSNYYTSDGSLPVGVAVSNADLLQTSLASATRTGTAAGDRYFYREDSGYTVDLGRLTDGAFGTAGGMSAYSVLPNQVTLTFTLNLTANPSGHTVTAIRTYAGWDSGRDGQEYTVQYSQVSDPTNFITLRAIDRYNIPEANFAYEAYEPSFLAMMRRMIPSYPAGRYITNQASTMVELTSSSGPLAVNVAAIRFVFGNYDTNTNAFENGGTAYREIDVIGSAPPTVTSISPNSGSTEGGTAITITGTDFTGATAVTLGGTAAIDVTVVSSTTITATTPAGSAGTASVLVTTPEGTNAANTLFTYLNAANNPNFGPPTSTADGFTVQISNHDANFTYGGSATASGTVAISGTGVVTVSGVAANTSSTATITTTRTNYASGSATVTATSLAAASTPAFGSTTRTADGFTVQISNYNESYTWAGTATASGTVVVSGTGLVTVSGVAANTSSTATITTTRTGYVGGSATVTATSLAAASTPAFGSTTSTTDGFTVQISNYNESYTWAGTATASGSVAIDSSGLVTVTGVAAGTSSTATITTTRTGYVGGSATVTATSLAAASTPAFGSTTRTADGFTVQISNYNESYTWAGTATASGSVAIDSSGLVTVTGVAAGTSSTATITTTRTGYVGGSATVTATSLAVPSAPTAVSVTSGNAQAVVSFTAPTSNGGATITSYTITATPVSGGSAVTATGSSSPITVTGLTNGTAYTFTVTATNSVGTSSASSASSSVIPVTVPGAPTALSGVSGNAQATVTFTAPVSNGGAAITGYTVTSNPAGGTDSNAGSTSLSHVITGLTNGTAYTFTVTATNSVGTSSASSASSSVTPILPVAITTQPINLTVAQGYPASFTVAASGTVPLTYQWLKNGIAISGATSATYTIATVATTDAGNYAVTITNAAGSVTSSAATLTVQAFNVLTANQNVIDGKSTAFMTGVSLGSTQWQISTDAGVTWTNLTNNSTYDGVTTNVLEILKVTTAMSKNRYRYQVTINNQITTSTAAVITVGTAFLLLPVGVQVDASGNLYVSDAAGQTVRKISSDFKISTLTGNALSQGSTDGVAGNAKLNEPTGLVLNADNSLLLADTSNAALRQISTVGTVTTFAGTSGSKGSTDATGTAARFSAPVGLTRDGSGNYYVADQTNHTIRKISASGVVTTLAGTAGQSGSVDGTGVAARLNLPTGITCNAQGDLYVSDLGSHLIRKITAAGVVTTLAGQAGASGSSDGSGTAALFFKPSGLAIDSAGNLYVADLGNSTLRKISASGVVSTLAGLPTIDGLMDGTGSNAWFAEPQGLTLDSAGNIYVADTANAVLRKVTPEGLVTTLALAGTAPLISTQPVSITISSGGTATFSVLAIGDAPLSYQWKKDGADLSGMVTTSYSVSPVTTFYAGNYTVAVTNAYGTTLSNTATLTVNGSPPATVNPPPATSGGGGGGGAVSPWFIGALGLLLLVRRTRRRE